MEISPHLLHQPIITLPRRIFSFITPIVQALNRNPNSSHPFPHRSPAGQALFAAFKKPIHKTTFFPSPPTSPTLLSITKQSPNILLQANSSSPPHQSPRLPNPVFSPSLLLREFSMALWKNYAILIRMVKQWLEDCVLGIEILYSAVVSFCV